MSTIIDPLKKLNKIGNKLLDFEPIKNGTKNYTLLGIGNFAYVEKMKSKKDNKIYAIKKIDLNSPQFNEKDFKRETEIMFLLDQENIIKLYGYFEDKENLNKYKEIYNDKMNKNDLNKLKEDITVFCLVFEFPKNGSLRDFYKNKIKNKDKNLVPIEEKTIINILKQLLNGLMSLHDKGVMLYDITHDNILLDEKNNVKITEFGISVMHKDSKTQNTKKDEQLSSTKACDSNSLGLTILYMMSYKNPISVTKNSEAVKNIHQKYDPYLRKLIEKMVDDDPKLRPTISDVYDELEVIEIFKTKPNNKILKKSLDELNSELERKKKENKQNKNFKKMNTDMDIKYKNDIKTENKAQINSGNNHSKEKEFISSNSIYSNPNKNSNVPQSCQAYNSIPTNPNYIANHSLNNSGIAGNYPDINHNFYHTQNNFRRSYVPQIPQIMPPPPSVEIKQKKSPKGIKKVLNKFAGFLLNEK
jgi:serine/threonine protein kinase